MREYDIQPSPLFKTSKSVYSQGVEGVWTPELTFDTPGDLSVAYTDRYATYRKEGTRVELALNIVTSTFTFTTAAGTLRINGIPFTPRPEGTIYPMSHGTLWWQFITKANYTQVGMAIYPSATAIYFTASGSGQGRANIVVGDITSGNAMILTGGITYYTLS